MLPGGFGNLYGLTPAQVAALANKEYSYGANQMVFHGLPYPRTPERRRHDRGQLRVLAGLPCLQRADR